MYVYIQLNPGPYPWSTFTSHSVHVVQLFKRPFASTLQDSVRAPIDLVPWGLSRAQVVKWYLKQFEFS